MSKFRKSILIIGILVIVVTASLATALALFATGSIKTDPIELVYSVRDAEKVYDGTPLKATEYRLSSGELIAGHTAQVEFIGEQTDVGVSSSDLQVKIYDAEGYNVSSSYTIRVEAGELAVTPKHVSVEMPSQKVVYNGSKVNFTSYTVTEEGGDLISGHSLSGSTEAGLMNVGDKIPEDLVPLVFDKAGEDVTANYKIEVGSVGDIEIIPRPISVRPVSYEKVYDGLILKCNEIEYLENTSIVEGQTVSYKINGGYDDSLTGVGELTTYVTDFKVTDIINGAEVDVTKNYELDDHESGLLKITPRPVTIAAKSESWVYNGLEHTLVGDEQPFSVEGLAETDEIKSVHYVGTIKNVGEEISRITSVDFTCNAENYDVTFIDGKLTVTPYVLHVKTGSDEKYYDGNPLSSEDVVVNDGNSVVLASSEHKFKLAADADYPEITNAGSISNEYLWDIFEGGEMDDGVLKGGIRVTSNYDITYEYGTLTVKKMPVTVTLATEETVEYDGEEHMPDLGREDDLTDKFTIKAIDEAHTETLGIDYRNFTVVPHVKSMVEAGVYSYSVNFKDKELNDNYTLEVTNYGYLTIEQRAITVNTSDKNKTYDGKPLTYGQYTVAAGTLVEGHKINLPKDLPTITNVGSTPNDFKITITDTVNDDVTKNYKITYVNGTLVVAKETVRVTLKSYTGTAAVEYRGTPYQIDLEKAITGISPDKIVEKSDFTAIVEKELLNVGTYTYSVKISDSLSENITLSIENATNNFEIKKKSVTVNIRNVERTYTGEEILLSSADVIHSIADDTHLLSRDDFSITYVGGATPVDADDYDFSLSIKDTKIKNYAPVYSNTANAAKFNGTLTVKRFAAVKYTTDDASFVYDGEEHLALSFKHTALANSKHVAKAVAEGAASLTDYGSVDNTFTVIIEDAKGNDVTVNYEGVILEEYGALSITKRPVTVATGTASRVFDGTQLYSEEADGDNLVEGHEIKVPETIPVISEFGSVKNVFEVEIFNGEDKVTDNYDITYDYGTLTIEKRTVTITTSTATHIYDAAPFFFDGVEEAEFAVYEYEDGADLFDSTQYVILIADMNEIATITDVGSTPNVFEVKIMYSDVDYSDNFVIKYKYGTLTVKPATVTVTLNTEAVYGYSGEQQEFNIGDLIVSVSEAYKVNDNTDVETGGSDEERVALGPDDFIAVFTETVVNAGKYNYTVKFKDGIKAGNYVFNSPIGSVLVNPMSIVVSFGDELAENPVYKKPFTNNAVTLYGVNVIENLYDEDSNALIPDEDDWLLTRSDFEIRFRDGEAKKAGIHYFYAVLTNPEKVKNFKLSGVDGRLEIEKPDVTVTLEDYVFTYSGEEHVIGTDGISTDNALLGKNHLRVTFPEGQKIVDAADDYTYSVEITDADYAENFNALVIVGGNVTVKPLKVTVSLKNYEFTYSGEAPAVTAEDALIIGSPLLSVSDFELTGVASAIDAGPHDYTAALKGDFVNAGNFELPAVIKGKIIINPLAVTVSLSNPAKVYDGNEIPVTDVSVNINSDKLTEADLTVEYSDNKDHSAQGTYSFVAKVTDGNKAKNFLLTVTGGTATVDFRRVSIYTADKVFTYNGTEQKYAQIRKAVNLAAGQAAVPDAETATTITDKGSLPNSMVCTIVGAGDVDVTNNYIITYYYGTLTVERAAITVTTNSATGNDAFIYDGTEHSLTTARCGVTGLTAAIADGADGTKVTDVGTYSNVFPVKLIKNVDGKEVDVTDNYNIGYVYGMIQVKPCEVKVSVSRDLKKTYTGEPMLIKPAEEENPLTIICGTAGLIAEEDFEITCSDVIMNAGVYYLTAKIKDSKAKNFDLVCESIGKLVVEPAELTVQLQSSNAVYTGKLQKISLDGMTIGANFDGLTANDFRAVTEEDALNVGKYNYVVELTDATLAKNYKITVTGAAASITVTAANLTVTLGALTTTYDGSAYQMDMSKAITAIAGVDKTVISKADFAASYVMGGEAYEEAILAGDYTYTVSVADEDFAKNFNLIIEGENTLTVSKRKIDIYLADVTVSNTDYEEMGGSMGYYSVESYVKVAGDTPICSGDKFRVSVAAGAAFNGEIELYAVEIYITDSTGTILKAYFADGMVEGEEMNVSGYDIFDCYEFNITQASDLSAKFMN